MRGSAGAGNQAEIPWVAILPPGLEGASEGRYVVYLFSSSGDAVYLALSQAVTGHAKADLQGLAEELREDAGTHTDLLRTIDLGAIGVVEEPGPVKRRHFGHGERGVTSGGAGGRGLLKNPQ